MAMTSPHRGSLHALRRDNRSRLLNLLRVQGPLHRAELARQAGVSRTTVSTIVNELIETGLVRSVEDPSDSGATRQGRPGDLLALNLSGQVVVGMDYSFQRVRVVVADLAHTVLAEGVSTWTRTRAGSSPGCGCRHSGRCASRGGDVEVSRSRCGRGDPRAGRQPVRSCRPVQQRRLGWSPSGTRTRRPVGAPRPGRQQCAPGRAR